MPALRRQVPQRIRSARQLGPDIALRTCGFQLFGGVPPAPPALEELGEKLPKVRKTPKLAQKSGQLQSPLYLYSQFSHPRNAGGQLASVLLGQPNTFLAQA